MSSAARREASPAPTPRALLTSGAASLGVELGEAQVDALLAYVELLGRWNDTYNLTAIRDPIEVVTHHLLDCLAVVLPLRRELAGATGRRLLDVGSGAGLPGLVIAIAEPDMEVVCVDSVGKKASFIAQAAGTLRASNVQAVHARVETLALPAFDVIASRAFASLGAFVSATGTLQRADGFWMAMKGRHPGPEVALLPPDLDCRIEPLRVPNLEAERCLVWMRTRRSARSV